MGGLSSLAGFGFFGAAADEDGSGEGGFRRGARTPPCPSLRHLDVRQLHERVYAMGKPWERATRVDARRNNVAELAKLLNGRHRAHYLVLNLCSDAKLDAFKFHEQVLEHDLESAPTLEGLFQLCHAVQYWLDAHEDNVLFFFCNRGVQTSRLFVAALLAFNGRFRDTRTALEYFYDRWVPRRETAKAILDHSSPSVRHLLDRFQQVLQLGALPKMRPLVAYMLIIEGLPAMTDKGILAGKVLSFFGRGATDEEKGQSARPEFRIFQWRGPKKRSLVYCSAADPDTVVQWAPRKGRVMLRCDCQLQGDIEVDCLFPATRKPLFRYYFHTGFVEKDVVTVSKKRIDTPFKAAFTDDFKMEMVIQPERCVKPSAASRTAFACMRPLKSAKHAKAAKAAKAKKMMKLNLNLKVPGFKKASLASEEAAQLGLEALVQMHLVPVDATLCEQLRCRGHDKAEARFALQRTRNNLYEAAFLLDGGSPRRVNDSKRGSFKDGTTVEDAKEDAEEDKGDKARAKTSSLHCSTRWTKRVARRPPPAPGPNRARASSPRASRPRPRPRPRRIPPWWLPSRRPSQRPRRRPRPNWPSSGASPSKTSRCRRTRTSPTCPLSRTRK